MLLQSQQIREFDYQPTLSGLLGLEAVAEAQEVQQHHKDSQQELDVRDPRHPSYWEPDDLQQEEQEVCKDLVQVLEKNHRDFSVLPSNRDCEKKEKTYQDQMSSTTLPAAHFLGFSRVTTTTSTDEQESCAADCSSV